MFTGDLLHSPLQVSRPDDICSFDLDADAARPSRRRILDRAAQTGATIFPAHHPGRGAVTVARGDDRGYSIESWARLPPHLNW